MSDLVQMTQIGAILGQTVDGTPTLLQPIALWECTIQTPVGSPGFKKFGQTSITQRFTGTQASARQQMLAFLNSPLGVPGS
jgi:hypothetical protein